MYHPTLHNLLGEPHIEELRQSHQTQTRRLSGPNPDGAVWKACTARLLPPTLSASSARRPRQRRRSDLGLTEPPNQNINSVASASKGQALRRDLSADLVMGDG